MRLARIAPPLALLLLALAGWQLGVRLGDVDPATLPAPSAVGRALWAQRTLLAEHAWVTVQEILVGYALAAALGVGLALLVAASPLVERTVYPWLVVSQTIPIVAIAPVLVLWTGFDLRPKVIVIALVSFFPIAVNTVDGLKATDPELLDLLRTLGAGRWRRLRIARLPSALPFVFSGLKVAAALAVIGAVFGEWVGADAGLGYLVLTFNNQLATAEMFATIAVLAALGIALFGLVALLERLLVPWRAAARDRRR